MPKRIPLLSQDKLDNFRIRMFTAGISGVDIKRAFSREISQGTISRILTGTGGCTPEDSAEIEKIISLYEKAYKNRKKILKAASNG
jgi:hypothetical protein